MLTLISAYEYDIFISYRHKDNRYDGWVTEFVTNLSKELEATFKEDISIYFDSNPHDGLLETHNVDKSLEGKLKCLIFIPIISQTYCDQSSFAWQHEFCVFNKLAKEDQFGRDVKLSNGNVASRILPIRIHDLDAEDKTLLERELGGVLRSVDFIYREAGVNRPLKPEDKKEDNFNKTGYRNQVNKVANAIKELIVGIQHAKDTKNEQSIQKKSIVKPRIKMFSWVAVIILLLGLVGFGLYYLGGIGNKITPTIDRSIAVIPFINMSDDPSQEYFSDGMTDEVLNHLFKIGDLRVISRTSSMKFKGAKLTTKEIAGQLGVTNILEGSVQKVGNRLKIIVQLIDANTDNHLWSESYEREFNDVFAIQSEIAEAVAMELRAKFSESAKRSFRELPTQSQLAYEYYLKGIQIFAELPKNAISLYTKALLEDSLFAEARYARIDAHLWIFWTKEAEKEKLDEHVSLANSDIRFLKERFPESPQYKRALAKYSYWVNRKYDEALTLYHEVLKENPGDLEASHYVATILKRQGRWKEAIEGFEQCLKSDPLNNSIRLELALIYNSTHQPEKTLDILKFGISFLQRKHFFVTV